MATKIALLMSLALVSPSSFAGVYLHYSCILDDTSHSSSASYWGQTLEIIYRQTDASAPDPSKQILTFKILNSPQRAVQGTPVVLSPQAGTSQYITGNFTNEPTINAVVGELKMFFLHLELKPGRSFSERSSPVEPEAADYYLPVDNFTAWMIADGNVPFSTKGKMRNLNCGRVEYSLSGGA